MYAGVNVHLSRCVGR